MTTPNNPRSPVGTVVQLGPGGSIPTSLTGFYGPVYPIQNTKTRPSNAR